MKILFLINPRSGTAKTDHVLEAIDEVFGETNHEYEVVFTRKKTKIEDLVAKELKEGFDTVVGVGGDGTISAIAHPLTNTSIKLGIIPAGTANIIARDLGIPTELQAALKLIRDSEKIRELDAIEVNSNYYYLRVSVGISSLTIKNITRRTKRLLGSFSYLWSGIFNYFTFNHQKFRLIIDGNTHKVKASDIVITNFGRIFFPGMNMDPNITPDDGLLDVFVFAPLKVKAIFKLFFGLVLKRKVKELRQFSEARKITIFTKKQMPVQADGDIIGYTPVQVKIVPRALKVIVP